MSPSLDVIIKAFEIPSELSFDDQGSYFIDENKDKIYCPEIFKILDDISFKNEVESIAKVYDFNAMRPIKNVAPYIDYLNYLLNT